MNSTASPREEAIFRDRRGADPQPSGAHHAPRMDLDAVRRDQVHVTVGDQPPGEVSRSRARHHDENAARRFGKGDVHHLSALDGEAVPPEDRMIGGLDREMSAGECGDGLPLNLAQGRRDGVRGRWPADRRAPRHEQSTDSPGEREDGARVRARLRSTPSQGRAHRSGDEPSRRRVGTTMRPSSYPRVCRQFRHVARSTQQFSGPRRLATAGASWSALQPRTPSVRWMNWSQSADSRGIVDLWSVSLAVRLGPRGR